MNRLDKELLDQRFAATEPKRHGLLILYALVMAVIACMILLPAFGPRWGVPDEVSLLLLLTLISLLVGTSWRVGRRQQTCRRSLVKAADCVQLEQWEEAWAALDALTQRPIRSILDRGQAFMLVAALAEHDGHYEAAAHVYETLLWRGIGDPASFQQAQIALAAMKIRNQELTDAVNMLGRLEQIPMPPALKAALDVARLFQQVFMGQYEDAVQQYQTRRQLYRRHLSTRAGYGYGLLAAAMHHLGRREDAAALWRDATLLVQVDRLVREYDVLAPIARVYPATRHPL